MNGNSSGLTDFLVYGIIVAGILVMTRPGSQGPRLVSASTNGVASIVKAETGQG